MSEERQQVLARACDLLARREHSRKELKNKLTRDCSDEDLLENLLQTLTNEGLQSDERFTEHFIHHRLVKGQGPLKIKQELKQKGIEGELIQLYLYEQEHDWYQLVRSVREKRFGSDLPKDLKNKAKQSRFLYSRGFDTDMINYAFDKVDE